MTFLSKIIDVEKWQLRLDPQSLSSLWGDGTMNSPSYRNGDPSTRTHSIPFVMAAAGQAPKAGAHTSKAVDAIADCNKSSKRGRPSIT